MTDKELLEKAARRFRVIADDTNRITSGNLSHNLTCLRGFALRAAESIEKRLQEEPVSEFPNTESMIELYKQKLISQANGMKNSPLIDMCLTSYKHGINETLDTLNLSNVQRNVKNWKEPVSDDLEETARWYADSIQMQIDLFKNNINKKAEIQEEDVYTAFKAGAQWQKEQTMTKACEYLDLHCNEVKTEDNGIAGWIDNEFITNFRKAMEEQ